MKSYREYINENYLKEDYDRAIERLLENQLKEIGTILKAHGFELDKQRTDHRYDNGLAGYVVYNHKTKKAYDNKPVSVEIFYIRHNMNPNRPYDYIEQVLGHGFQKGIIFFSPYPEGWGVKFNRDFVERTYKQMTSALKQAVAKLG